MSSARLALRLRCTAIRNRQLGRPACAAVNATAPRSQIRNYLEPAPLCYRPLPKVNPDDVLDPALAEYFKEESNTEAPEAGDNATTAVPPTPETTPEPTKFSRTGPKKNPEQERDHKLNDERTINLGKTLRTLQPLLPSLLISPLPTSILAPSIRLHLFPSTHPHLPVVQGRVAYIAALWTSPLAWGRVPLIGNVKLEILSERMVRGPLLENLRDDTEADLGSEQLVVRWKTVGPASSSKLLSSAAKMARKANLSGGARGPDGQIVETQGIDKEFTGLFIFAFDEKGRIVRHVIEHVQEHGDWEKSAGARVVGLTDWLLGGLTEKEPAPSGGLGSC